MGGEYSGDNCWQSKIIAKLTSAVKFPMFQKFVPSTRFQKQVNWRRSQLMITFQLGTAKKEKEEIRKAIKEKKAKEEKE